jgi:hypothetical protein
MSVIKHEEGTTLGPDSRWEENIRTEYRERERERETVCEDATDIELSLNELSPS